MSPHALIAVSLVGLLAVNAFATFQIVRDSTLEKTQAAAQCFIVWGIPVLGVIVVLSVRHHLSHPRPAIRDRIVNEMNEIGH